MKSTKPVQYVENKNPNAVHAKNEFSHQDRRRSNSIQVERPAQKIIPKKQEFNPNFDAYNLQSSPKKNHQSDMQVMLNDNDIFSGFSFTSNFQSKYFHNNHLYKLN